MQAVYELNAFNKEREVNGIQYVQERLPITDSAIITMHQDDNIKSNIKTLSIYRFSNWLNDIF